MKTSDILDEAADLIEERGWTRGSYVGPCGQLCASGAMFAAVGVEPNEFAVWPENWSGYTRDRRVAQGDAYVEFERWILANYGRFGVHGWNDAEGRTKDEVVSALRAAAQAARAES